MLHQIALALVLSAARLPAAVVPDSARAEEDLRITVLRNARDVRRCYEKEGLRRNAQLKGTVEVELTILPTGVVEHVAVTTLGLEGDGARETSACVATAARHWRFERGPFVVETVVFPFFFAPNGRQLTSSYAIRDPEPRDTNR
jgi:hypothetical protein